MDDTRGLLAALQRDEPFDAHLTERFVGSDPFRVDTDGDGLTDLEEVKLGTSPRSLDTDGDAIADGRESAGPSDPTLHDITPPTLDVFRSSFHKPALSLETTCFIGFSAADQAGVGRTAVYQGDELRLEWHHPDHPDAVGHSDEFTTGAGDTLLEQLLGTRVKVAAGDRHGNGAGQRKVALERTNFYGHVAGKLGSDTIFTRRIANDLGQLSGFTVGAGETAEMVKIIAEDPVEVLQSLQQFIGLLDDLGVLQQVIEQLPASIREKQELNNPYDPDRQPGLYNEYKDGWYGGYVSYFVVEAVVGASAVKAAKSSSKLAKVIDSVPGSGKLTTFAKYASRAKRTAEAPQRIATTYLIRGAVEGTKLTADGGRRVFRGARTIGGKTRVSRQLRRIDTDAVDRYTPGEQTRLGQFISRAGGLSAPLVDRLGANRVRRALSASADAAEHRTAYLHQLAKASDCGVDDQKIARIVDEVDELDPAEQRAVLRAVKDGDLPLADLADNLDEIDDVVRRDGMTVIRGKRSGSVVEARYVDDGGRYIDELDAGDGASKGELGERAAYDVADDRDLDVADGFTKDSANQQGIDLIAVDDDGNYVLIEAKFTSRGGNVGKGDLRTATANRQMSDDWNDVAVLRMEDQEIITSGLADDLETAMATGDVRKEMVVIKNTPKTGRRLLKVLRNLASIERR